MPNTKLSVLDVGGRYQPYRPLLNERISRYVGLDIEKTDFVDVVGSGEALPFIANTFDLVIATQVFDLFRDVHLAAAQMHAVLKPGGTLLVTFPAFTPRFVSQERWRFLPSGIQTLLKSFSKVEIVPEVSNIGGLIRTLNLGVETLAYYGIVRRLLGVTLFPALNVAGLALENIKVTKGDQFTANYSVMAIK